MFIGSGNLIFPPSLGQLVGKDFLLAMLGFNLSGFGLVLLSVLATAKAGGKIQDLTNTISKRFGLIFGLLVLLCIGPGLLLPRTAATTYEIIRDGLGVPVNQILVLIVFFMISFSFR